MPRLSALFVPVVVLVTPALGLATDWEEIRHEQGVTVWRAEVEGSNIVKFMGQGIVSAPMVDVFSVLYDHDHRCEWQDRCDEAYIIKWLKEIEGAIGYYRIEGSGPVSDRDVVFEARVKKYLEKGTIQVNFWNIKYPSEPPRDGAVRMPTLKGFWRVRKFGRSASELTYQVQADPGGWIPSWVANYVSKKLPFNAIVNIRAHIKRGGQKRSLPVVRTLADWPAFKMAQ